MEAKAKILVVEDERIVAEDIQRSLIALGYQVVGMASSGKDALRLVEEKSPELILMDIVIRGNLTGIDTSHQIRRQYNIPVVYLTAYADSRTLELAKETDPFGYLLKPFNDRELASTIEMALYKHGMDRRLRESEAWFSTTLESMADGVIATNEASSIIFFNKTAARLTGWSQADALGQELGEVIDLHDEASGERVIPVTQWEGLESPLRSQHRNTLLVARNGQRIPIDESAAPIRNDRGDVLGTVLVIKDVTERRKAQDEIQEERDFINTLLQVSPAFYVAIDADGRIIMMNDAACQATGFSRKEVAGRDFVAQFIPQGERERAETGLREMIHSRETFDGETRVLTRDGRELLVAWHGKPVYKRDAFDFYFVMGMNITLRRQTELALRHSEERYRGLFETMAQGVVYFDESGLVTASNRAAEKIFRRPLTDMLGLKATDACWDTVTESGEAISAQDHPVSQALRLGQPVTGSVIGVLTPDEERRWLLMDVTPVATGDQGTGRVFTTFTDITRRKEMELTLSRRNFQLKALNDLARRVSGSLELEAIGEAALDEVLRLTGYMAGALFFLEHRGGGVELAVQQGLDAHSYEPLLDQCRQSGTVLSTLLRSGEIVVLGPADLSVAIRFSTHVAHHGGPVHGLVAPIREGARIVGALMLFDEAGRLSHGADADFLTNVGHHIGLAVHNGKLYREANQALEKLKITQEKLVESEKLAGLGAMASNVVHEIGNPLAAISNSIQVLQGRLQLEGRMKELLDIIGWETDRLERSVNELREFSKPKRLHFVSCDLVEVVKRAIFVLNQDVELIFGRRLTQKFPAKLPLLSIDPDAIEQVTINLIKNALQAVPEGGVVDVHLKKECMASWPCVALVIADNGPGIAPENLERVFEPYFSTKARGMGLGMHIVKTHVEAHGGSLTIESKVGKGTTVRVRLPLLRGEDD